MTQVVKKPITAVLKDVIVVPVPGSSVHRRLHGTIYADSRDSFSDGTRVLTSSIVAVYGDVIYTKNSVYYVASWGSPL